MEVRRISSQDTYRIRQLFNPSNYQFRGDDDDQTFHLGAFEDKKLVGIASFYYNKNQYVPGEHHFEIRGTATSPNFQRQKKGTILVKTAITMIKQNLCDKVWVNADCDSIGFYQKLGFTPIGDVFHLDGAGSHLLMVLEVN